MRGIFSTVMKWDYFINNKINTKSNFEIQR
jgi:hypothetical protein